MGSKEFRPITSACWDREVRLADMDRDGIDGQIVSATPVLFAYKRSAEQALECAHIFNDALPEITEGSNGRLIPFCQVPLPHVYLQTDDEAFKFPSGVVGDEAFHAVLGFKQGHMGAIGAIDHPYAN